MSRGVGTAPAHAEARPAATSRTVPSPLTAMTTRGMAGAGAGGVARDEQAREGKASPRSTSVGAVPARVAGASDSAAFRAILVASPGLVVQRIETSRIWRLH